MRAGWALVAVGLALSAGCGSSDAVRNPAAAGPRASEADTLAIGDVANAVVAGQSPGHICNVLLDPTLVEDFYRTKPICRREVAAAAAPATGTGNPATAAVTDVDVQGARATAVVTATGGAADGATGTWNFVRTPTGWRVEDWSPEYLHSIFEVSFGPDYRVSGADDPLGAPRVRDCVSRQFQDKEDAEIRSAAKTWLRGGDAAAKLVADAVRACSEG